MYDNYAKNADLAKPVAELALAQSWPVKTYVFVSSGRSVGSVTSSVPNWHMRQAGKGGTVGSDGKDSSSQ